MRIGDRVGAYELLSELGQGGMGMVYLARRADDQFQKKVAIKLIRPGMASEFSLQRFRSERQISASLEHPNIARLFDGGATAHGMPYFVLEYVDGEPLTEYCENRSMPIPDRLRLFLEVCRLVMYAHQNLVVHRDIKPRNILATPKASPSSSISGSQAPSARRRGRRPLGDGHALPDDDARLRQPRADPRRGITTASDVYALGSSSTSSWRARSPMRSPGTRRGAPAGRVRA